MADKIGFDVVSPERLLLSEDVDMVVIPAEEGDMGVMAGHAPVIANVRPGTIAVFSGNSVQKRYFVAGGFLEVTGERCTVLAEQATPIEDIDISATQSQIKDLSEDVSHAKDEREKEAAEADLALARAKLQAAESPAYK
ncbi:F0F1 ATP synthase subunit epsilon [Marivibrio halodurans]|uniref:ATP synthase epsilon chain n=1 Tax=Marivibrio halodurans TaxID=2039722 RepID=A0A8J7V456_9PROT|nr:F0F1 ATP synthase subunit epsilon [Marivibrio halodurans]MBP5859001.1 F0F1 ATP synthase subunit epsilon [Marivibrio halodurans]